VGSLFYLYGLPKKANFVSQLLGTARNQSREEKLKVLAEEKVRNEICPISDLCDYRPIHWTDFSSPDTASASIVHEFYADEKKMKFLFRMRHGNLDEVINMN
jgi:hypothetical protein